MKTQNTCRLIDWRQSKTRDIIWQMKFCSFLFIYKHYNKTIFIAVLGQECIVFVEDFSVTKTPSSNGKKFFISSPSSQGRLSHSLNQQNGDFLIYPVSVLPLSLCKKDSIYIWLIVGISIQLTFCLSVFLWVYLIKNCQNSSCRYFKGEHLSISCTMYITLSWLWLCLCYCKNSLIKKLMG